MPAPGHAPKLMEIFSEAVELPSSAERAAYLECVCGEDPEMRRCVEGLLDAHDKVDDFLESPAQAPTIDVTPGERCEAESPGTSIGPYRLMEQIGEGGMGVVYVAEQAHPVRRRVALKVIKPGMDTKQVIARFEAERQALAMMDHPNIAKVHDGGTTASGRPYFVMELVRGIPITEYCDGERLPIRERLELFVLVCRAVQHAHQKGIIHRDLKPTNILVTLHDGVPVPKVIDFGVAKATGQSLTEKTIYTAFTQLVGTPMYMSPEQVELSGLDIDTRSDIYSLGVLLYELLTGTTPFDSESLRLAAFDEMRRMIREDEPPTPSIRLSSLGETITTTSAKRSSDPRHLNRSVRGELDWIAMKALEKDRRRRYETANDFAADVMRHMTDQPVEACPPSASYRLTKFARRNRGALATAAVVSSALVLGTVISIWQAIRATQANAAEAAQRQRADVGERQARANLKKAREAVDQMLLRVAGRLADIPHMEQVRRELLGDSLKFYEGFLQEQGNDPEVRFETGLAYYQFGAMQMMLGEDRPAEQTYLQAIRIFQELADRSPDKAEYRLKLAYSHNNLGILLKGNQGRFSEAEQAFRQALAITRKLDADFPNSWRGGVPALLNNIGLVLYDQGRLAEAESFHREALAIRTEFGSNSGALWESYMSLGNVLWASGRFAEAEQTGRQALALQEKLAAQGPGNPFRRHRLAETHTNLGACLIKTGRLTEAEKSDRESLAISEKLTADFPNVPAYRDQLAICHHNLGELLLNTDRLPEAESAYRRSQDISEKLAIEFPGTLDYRYKVGVNLGSLGFVLLDTGRLGEAQRLIHRSLADAEKLVSEFPDATKYRMALANTHAILGISRYRNGDWKAALASLKKGFELQKGFEFQGEHEHDGEAQFVLAMAQWQLGDREQARTSYDHATQWMDKNEPFNERLRRFRTEAEQLLKNHSGNGDPR